MRKLFLINFDSCYHLSNFRMWIIIKYVREKGSPIFFILTIGNTLYIY